MNEEETKETSCISMIFQTVLAIVLIYFFIIPILDTVVFPYWTTMWQKCGASLTTCFASASLW